jgi:hypothetical protein
MRRIVFTHALVDRNFQAEFEVSATEIQTFEEVEVHVHVEEGGHHVAMHDPELEMRHEASGQTQHVAMGEEGSGYAAHVMFFEPGAYHLHMVGVPSGHTIRWEVGEAEVDVVRRHEAIGPYWVELSAHPAPVLEHTDADLHFHVYELLPDQTRGTPVGGLVMQIEIHAPDGSETIVQLTEGELGEYEGAHAFGDAGEYEFHVEIEGLMETGEFHFTVLSPQEEEGEGNGGGGHGHP